VDSLEYKEWAEHPLTKKYLKFLKDYRLKVMEDWAVGSYSFPSTDQTAIRNSEMLGRALMLRELSNLDDSAISEFYRGE
jgi:hypothetical protein